MSSNPSTSGPGRPAQGFSFRRIGKLILRTLVFAYLACGAYLYFAQRSLLYFPCAESTNQLRSRARGEGFVQWTNQAGSLLGWWRPALSNAIGHPMMVCHGNGGCALDRASFAEIFQRGQNFDMFLFEYPGYPGRAGIASEASIFQAAREAFQSLTRRGGVAVVGESLGTGVAAYLAGSYPMNTTGLLLIAPFNNLSAVAESHFPIFPARWILKDKYASEEHLRQFPGPMAVVLAGQDEVVPNRLGRKLYDEYRGRKKLWLTEEASHNTVSDLSPVVRDEILAFWRGVN